MAKPTSPREEARREVVAAYSKRRALAEHLRDQDLYIGHIVRAAREAGNTWASIAEASGTSDVAVIKASRRPPIPKDSS